MNKQLISFFAILSDPIKLQILNYLKKGKLNTKEIKNKLDISQSYVSQQLKELVSEDLLEYYRNKKREKIYNIKHRKIYDILEKAKLFIKEIEMDKYKRLFGEDFQSKILK